MELSRHIIKDDQIIGIGPLMLNKLASSNGTNLWGYFYYEIYTVSNTIPIRTDNLLHDAVNMKGSNEQQMFYGFKDQYHEVKEKIRVLVGKKRRVNKTIAEKLQTT
jgi:hypothetical protein